ncbi:MAG: outer membrane beta-barrel protein [Terrimonas sp.]|nr:outer membrane beta-barrel protein [Terrimonas sp.]
MIKARFLSFLFLLAAFSSIAQEPVLKGVVKDGETKLPLADATVRLTASGDSTIRYNTLTNKQGVFQFTAIKPLSYRLEISYSGFEITRTDLAWKNSSQDLGDLLLLREAKTLGDVTIISKTAAVRVKNDTTEFSASQFKVNPDANSEDLIKKMPGVTVENGVVKAGGEQVKKVTVDGRDFFGDDATATLRNLPAEIVDKIQVFDKLSDQAQLTGIDDGNAAKSINIVTKANMRNGQFGRVFAGYGTDNHYLAGGNMSFFKNTMRLSLVGLTNDVNQQNFTEMDLLGATSSSNRGGFRGGGSRGGSYGGYGGGNNGFLVGQQPGVSKTNSFGINYNDQWGKKTEVSGSYFFNNRKLNNKETLSREYFLNGDSSQFYDQTALSSSNNYNHRANLRINYKIDSFNSIMITPSVNFQRYNSFNETTGYNFYDAASPISSTVNRSNATRDAINFNNNVLYRHSFKKRGRTFSAYLTTGVNNNSGEIYNDAFSVYYKGINNNLNDSLQQYTNQQTKGLSLSANLNYSEPVGKKGIIQFSYNPSYSLNKSDKQAFLLDNIDNKYNNFDSLLSNVFKNTYVTQKTGLAYRMGDRDKNISIGLDYQAASLNSDQTFPYSTTVKRTFSNLLPSAMMRLDLSKQSNIRLFYRAYTNPPSVTQLQDVINNSNPLQLSTGNPDLKQQYAHRLGIRYQFTNTKKGQSFFANIFGSTASDYVATATYIAQRDSVLNSSVTLFKGSQLSKPVNLNGQWSVNTFLTYGAPLNFIKTTMNINAGVVYNRTPGLINNVANVSNANTFNTGITFASNISQYIDFTVIYNAGFSNVKNSLQPNLNNKYISEATSLRLNLLSKSGWLFNSDLNNQIYSGLTDGFNQNYWLWNMAVAKKFMKNQRGELRLSVFDLLNQNQSITRTTTETYIEDVNTQVIKQYFMLTFTLNLKNFGKAPANNNRRNFEGFDRGGYGPPRGGGGPGGM